MAMIAGIIPRLYELKAVQAGGAEAAAAFRALEQKRVEGTPKSSYRQVAGKK